MGYKEEIFERLEIDGFESQEAILDWLRKDKSEKVVRGATGPLIQLSEDFSKPFDYVEGIPQIKTIAELNKIEVPEFGGDLVIDAIEERKSEILVRNKEVASKGREYKSLASKAQSLPELESIAREARSFSDQYEVADYRSFFGRTFEENARRIGGI